MYHHFEDHGRGSERYGVKHWNIVWGRRELSRDCFVLRSQLKGDGGSQLISSNAYYSFPCFLSLPGVFNFFSPLLSFLPFPVSDLFEIFQCCNLEHSSLGEVIFCTVLIKQHSIEMK